MCSKITTNLPVPQPLVLTDSNKEKNFSIFQQTWENYEIATGLSKKDDKICVATLLTVIGPEALQVYKLSDGKMMVIKQLLQRC